MNTLRAATDDEKRARDRLTHPVWGTGLDVDQYLDREARLRAHPWTRAGMTTWLLVDERDTPLASCETLASRSYLEGQAGVTHAIASVFTESALRGRGHAVELISRVVERVREQPDAHAVTLYSDVGARIYERSGFFAVTSIDRVFLPEVGDPTEGVVPVFSDDVGDAPPPVARFVVWPDPTQLDWHRERERAYAALLGRARPPLMGARVGSDEIVFSADLKNDRLLVLRLSCTSVEAARVLVRAAARTANAAGLARVVVWEDPTISPYVREGRVEPRSGGLAMIHPIAPSLSPVDWAIVPRGTWV